MSFPIRSSIIVGTAALLSGPTLANNYIDCDPFDGFALTFDGVNSQVQVGPVPELVMTNTFTMEAWVRPTNGGEDDIIINKEGEYEFARFDDGTFRWAIAPEWTWVDTGYVLGLNVWTHVAVTYDNGTITTYANGQVAHTATQSSPVGDQNSSANDFRIGARQLGGQHFDGQIEEVRMWTTVRTQQELLDNIKSSLTGTETGLVGYWPMDEGSGVAVTDLAGGNTGFQINTMWSPVATCIACGPFDGFALDLDGVDDYVQVQPRPEFEMLDEFTLEAWIHPTGPDQLASTRGVIVGQEGEYVLARDVNGRIYWAIANTDPGWTWIDTGYTATDRTWTHLALVYLDGIVKFYADGVLEQTYLGAGAVVDTEPDVQTLSIGARDRTDGTPIQYFDGRIDDVRVWTRARTQSTIQSQMTATLTGSEPDLSAYFRFNDGPTGLTENTANTGDGAVIGALWHEASDCMDAIFGDLDGDMEVGFSDLLVIIGAWGPCAGCPADLDGDGTVGFGDLLQVIGAWT